MIFPPGNGGIIDWAGRVVACVTGWCKRYGRSGRLAADPVGADAGVALHGGLVAEQAAMAQQVPIHLPAGEPRRWSAAAEFLHVVGEKRVGPLAEAHAALSVRRCHRVGRAL